MSSEIDRRSYFLQLNRSLQRKVLTWVELDDFKRMLEIMVFRTRRSEAFIKFYNTEQDRLFLENFRNMGISLFGKQVWHLRGYNPEEKEFEKIKIDHNLNGLNKYQYFELTFKFIYKQKTIHFQDFRSYMHLWMIMHPGFSNKK
jgi:hypothetical protein